MRKFFLGLCLFLGVACCGCVSEATKRLIADVEGIGQFLEGHSADPAIIQAGTDVRLDAAEIKTDVGAPKVAPAPYTPAQSAVLRQQAQQSRENRWSLVSGIIGILSSPLLPAGAMTVITAALGWLLKRKTTVANSMSDGIEALKNLVPVEGQSTIDKTLRDIAMDAGIYHEQKRLYRKRVAAKKKLSEKKSDAAV